MTSDGTPEAQPEWATGPVRDLTDPRTYLPDDPTEDELRLADTIDPGSINVHLAKVAIRGWGHAVWIRGADRRDKLARWLARVVITAALANVAAIAYHWLSAHDAQIVAAAEARAAQTAEVEYRRGIEKRLEAIEQRIASDKGDLQRILEMLHEDIRELRRHAGLDPRAISIVKAP